jgi:hypothetical protein
MANEMDLTMTILARSSGGSGRRSGATRVARRRLFDDHPSVGLLGNRNRPQLYESGGKHILRYPLDHLITIVMATSKRKHHEDGPSQSNKSRARVPGEAYARVDPTYGQRSAIPGLDDETSVDDEGTLNYDEDMDAIAYLRSVRLVAHIQFVAFAKSSAQLVVC